MPNRTKAAADPFEVVRTLAKALPGVEEGTSYGTPAFKVHGKLIIRLHQDGESLVLKTNLIDREVLLQAAPTIYFVTPHYEGYPWVLLRLGVASRAELERAVKRAWEAVAPLPKTHVKGTQRSLPSKRAGKRTKGRKK